MLSSTILLQMSTAERTTASERGLKAGSLTGITSHDDIPARIIEILSGYNTKVSLGIVAVIDDVPSAESDVLERDRKGLLVL